MTAPRLLSSLLTALLIAPAVAGSALAAQPDSTALKQVAARQLDVRRKISELFARRDEPPEKAGPEANPFVRKREPVTDTGPATVVTATEGLEDPNLTPDERILASLIKVIRVAGIVTVAQRQYLVINQLPIPEGGVAIIEFNGVARPLRVERIATGEVTLSHGSARMIYVY